MNWKGLTVGCILPSYGDSPGERLQKTKINVCITSSGFTNKSSLSVSLGTLHVCCVLSHIPASQQALIKPWDWNFSPFLSCVISQQCFTGDLHDIQRATFICCNQNNQFYSRKIRPMWGGRVVLSKVSPVWAGLSSQGAVTKSRSTETFLFHSLKVSSPMSLLWKRATA